MDPEIAQAFKRYEAARDTLQATIKKRGDDNVPADAWVLHDLSAYTAASGDLAVKGLDAYAKAVAEDREAARDARKAAEANERTAIQNGKSMACLTRIIAFATVAYVVVAFLQWRYPRAIPETAQHVTGPTINLPPQPQPQK